MTTFILALLLGCAPEQDPFDNVPSNPNEPDADTDADADTDTDTDTDTVDTPCENRTVGTDVGLCAMDFTLESSSGEMVSLYDFTGNVIYIDFSDYT